MITRLIYVNLFWKTYQNNETSDKSALRILIARIVNLVYFCLCIKTIVVIMSEYDVIVVTFLFA